MCMEDIRLGRKMQYIERQYTLGNAYQQVLAASPNRVGILVPAARITIHYLTTSLSPVTRQGIAMSVGGSPLIMSIKELGQLVCATWYASNDTASTPFTIFEILLADT